MTKRLLINLFEVVADLGSEGCGGAELENEFLIDKITRENVLVSPLNKE
jgi:hypothetical protein